jgi:hypothetical protein
VSDDRFARARRVAAVGIFLSWVFVVATFVGLLGGLHPPDALRDEVIRVAAVLTALANLPALWVLAVGARRGEPRLWLLGYGARLAVRVFVTVWAFEFAHSISHEQSGSGVGSLIATPELATLGADIAVEAEHFALDSHMHGGAVGEFAG